MPTRQVMKVVLLLAVGAIMSTMLGGAVSPVSKPSTSLTLTPEKLPFTLTEFFVADVLDARSGTTSVALLLSTTTPATGAAKPQAVDLNGGAAEAIKQYLKGSLTQNTNLRPVVMRLKELQLTETPLPKARVEGQLQYVVAFEVKREGKLLHLFDYKSGARYNRPANQAAKVEPMLQKAIAESVKYLHQWMEKEVKHNEKLARSLKINFLDYTQNTEPDTLFYDPNRTLAWSDFLGGSVRSPKFAASIFPGLVSDSYSEVKDGVIHVTTTVRVYALRQLSRVRPDSKTAYILNHEQRHFDIVKLVAEHYKQRILNRKLTLQDYDSMIKYEYLEALWELDRLQKQYDSETDHGLNHAAQARWNRKIDEELKTFTVASPQY